MFNVRIVCQPECCFWIVVLVGVEMSRPFSVGAVYIWYAIVLGGMGHARHVRSDSSEISIIDQRFYS